MEQERRTEGRKHKSVKKQGRGGVRKSVKDRGTRETDGQTKETDGKTRETDVRGWGMRERERKRGTRERGRERENGERMERGDINVFVFPLFNTASPNYSVDQSINHRTI